MLKKKRKKKKRKEKDYGLVFIYLRVGMPECDLCLAQCVVYMARCKKSIEVYEAYGRAKKYVETHKNFDVPLHIRNPVTKLMRKEGYGQGYVYTPHGTKEENERQTFLPPDLLKKGIDFFVEKNYDEDLI
jgi:putative ATPase